MDMSNIWSTVSVLINLFMLLYVLRLRRKVLKSHRTIRHLSRSIHKLNSKNGDLWYKIARARAPQMAAEENTAASVTITKI